MENMEKKKRKTKILYVITKSNWGGAQAYVYDLATNLPEEFDAVVALGGNGPLQIRLEEAGIRTVSLPFLERNVKLFADLAILVKLISLFRKECPDIVHLNSSKIGGLGALAGRIARVPNIIFTAHGWAFREEWRGVFQNNIIKFLSWFTMLWSHSVIAVSERDLREALAFPFVKRKIILISISKPETKLLSKNAAREALYEKNAAQDAENALWIGTIGELHKNKGHKYAIEAISAVRARHDVLFFIIGEGEERRALEKMIAELELQSRVFLLGNKDAAAALLPAFDVFLFPSIKEGLPYAVLEAGSAGLPIIASAVGGIPEIITDMESGILVRPKSADEIVKALEYILSHPKEAAVFGDKLRSHVKKRFSFEKMLRETIAAYRKKPEMKW